MTQRTAKDHLIKLSQYRDELTENYITVDQALANLHTDLVALFEPYKIYGTSEIKKILSKYFEVQS